MNLTTSQKSKERTGFTLVELLIAIAVIGIMASMVVYTLAGAQADAKRSKTVATITKINAVILQKFEEFRYRSVKLTIPQRLTQRNFGMTGTPPSPPLLSPKNAAKIRTFLLKDIMRMELPDRMTDLTYSPGNIAVVLETGAVENLNDFGGRYCPRDYNVLRSHFNLAYMPELYSSTILAAEDTTPLSTSRDTWTEDYAAEECLYAIVAHSMVAGGSALENFHASEIGDVDGDTYPEFIDAWGNPIGWLRWPAAYPSELNVSYKGTLPSIPNTALPPSPDAFDPYKTSAEWANTQKPWTLIPLIVSGGPDGDLGFASYNSGTDPLPIYATPRTTPFNATTPSINPWFPSTDDPRVGRLRADPTAALDNISNHDILLE